MTAKEYWANKERLDKQYLDINDKADELGFGTYNDGSGDFGTRRLYRDNLCFELYIVEMEEDYWSGEYPDDQFYSRPHNNLRGVIINTPEELETFVTNDENYSYKISQILT